MLRGMENCRVVQQRVFGYKDRKQPTAEFNLVCNNEINGFIELRRSRIFGKAIWAVDGITIEPHLYRKGYGTALYTAAAKFACRKRSRLASVARQDPAHSYDFWVKQERKGRATRVHRPWMGSTPREARMFDVFMLNACGPNIDLSGYPSGGRR